MSQPTPPAARSAGRLPERLRRRRRLLAWSAPVVLMFLVVGSLLLGTVFGNHLGGRDYEALRYEQAATQYRAQQRWTGFVEQWKAWFNSGTAEYSAGQHFAAVEDLRVALDRVPEAGPLPGGPAGSKAPGSPECRVRTNLSLGLEAMGDDAAATDDSGMAAVYYAEAQEAIAPCTTDPQNEESSQRQKDKEDQARENDGAPPEEPEDEPTDEPTDESTDEPTNEPTDEPTGESTADPTTEPEDEATQDPQREELEERQREAERDRQEREERGRGGTGGSGQNW